MAVTMDTACYLVIHGSFRLISCLLTETHSALWLTLKPQGWKIPRNSAPKTEKLSKLPTLGSDQPAQSSIRVWITAQINTFYTNESQISNVSAPVSVSSEKLPKNFRQQKWSTTNAPNILVTVISSGNPLWPSKNRARLHYYAFYPWRTG